MITDYTQKRLGNEIADEERAAYSLGFRDACEAMRSDEVYYEVCNAKQTLYSAVCDAAKYVAEEDR